MPELGVIYTIYGAYGPVVDITGNKANLYLYYQDTEHNGPINHPALPVSGPPGAEQMGWWWLFSMWNLQGVMDQMWADATPGLEAQVKSLTSGLGFSVTLRPSIPATGSLRACAPAAIGQILVLDYWVPVSYEVDCELSKFGITIDPVVRVSFDVEVMIVVQLWAWPVLQFSATTSLQNVNAGIINAGDRLKESLAGIFNDLDGFTNQVELKINSASIPSPDVSAFSSALNVGAQMASSLGLKKCVADVDPDARVLNVTLVHPTDPAPYAYDPALTQFGNYPVLGLTQYQVKPGAQVGVLGTDFPDSGELTVAWIPSSSGVVQDSYVNWGAAAGDNATVPGVQAEFSLAGPEHDITYPFMVRNFDGLQITPWSNQVNLRAVGALDLVLAYEAPRPPHLGGGGPGPAAPGTPQFVTEQIASVPANPGTFTLPVTVPANALPGLASLMAQSDGQTLASVEFTIVSDIQPRIYMYEPSSGVVLPPILQLGQTVYVHGEGFTANAYVRLFIDQAARGYLQVATLVQGDGTFTQPIPWPATADDDVPPSIATAGSHMIIARQIGAGAAQAFLTVTVLEPPEL
jgi:hypothetical protein